MPKLNWQFAGREDAATKQYVNAFQKHRTSTSAKEHVVLAFPCPT